MIIAGIVFFQSDVRLTIIYESTIGTIKASSYLK